MECYNCKKAENTVIIFYNFDEGKFYTITDYTDNEIPKSSKPICTACMPNFIMEKQFKNGKCELCSCFLSSTDKKKCMRCVNFY